MLIDGSAPSSATAVAVLPTNSADISHVAPVSAYGQPALARDLALLFWAHGRKTPPALLLPAFRFRTGATTGDRPAPLARAAGLPAPARSALLARPGARFALVSLGGH